MTYSDYKNSQQSSQFSKTREYKVGFFNKPALNETRTVRFNYGSNPDEIHMIKVHKVKKSPDDRYAQMSVACLDYENCPFCSHVSPDGTRNKPVVKAYLELLNYIKQPDGTIKVSAEAWEAPASLVDTLASIMAEWGDLRDIVCKVTCVKNPNGFTSYDVQVGNQMAYPESIYVKDFSNFEDYDVTKHLYYVKSAEDMKVYLETGKFPPYVKPETETTTTASVETTQSQSIPTFGYNDTDLSTRPSRTTTTDIPAPQRTRIRY